MVGNVSPYGAMKVAHTQLEAALAKGEQLHDPLQRADALVSAQNFADGPRTPGSAALEQMRREVLKRSEVQAAIAEVGSIQRFSVP